jgi:hypothetical protein
MFYNLVETQFSSMMKQLKTENRCKYINQEMTVDCSDMILQTLWPEAYSTAIHIKNGLSQTAFKLRKSPYEKIFGDKLSIEH